MDEPKSRYQSFIVKIWLEETTDEAGRATWRGHVTHVPGGKRRYIRTLDEIAAFIAPYLEAMGVAPRAGWGIGQWMRRWKP